MTVALSSYAKLKPWYLLTGFSPQWELNKFEKSPIQDLQIHAKWLGVQDSSSVRKNFVNMDVVIWQRFYQVLWGWGDLACSCSCFLLLLQKIKPHKESQSINHIWWTASRPHHANVTAVVVLRCFFMAFFFSFFPPLEAKFSMLLCNVFNDCFEWVCNNLTMDYLFRIAFQNWKYWIKELKALRSCFPEQCI